MKTFSKTRTPYDFRIIFLINSAFFIICKLLGIHKTQTKDADPEIE